MLGFRFNRSVTATAISLITLIGSQYSQAAENINPIKKLKKPNVIVIYSDDISARELPIYGASVWAGAKGKSVKSDNYRAKTPVLDQIANQGAWVKNAWAATVCSPSRAMMMTGRYASLHKWWHNGDYGRKPAVKKKKKGDIIPLYESSPLQLGHLAQKAGYATMWTGKTQMKVADHQRFGFDEGVFTPGSFMFGNNPNTDFKLVPEGSSKKAMLNKDGGQVVQSYAQTSWYWKPSVSLMNHPDATKPIEYWPNTAKSKKNFGADTYGPDVELDFIFDFMERKQKEGKPFFVYHTTHLGHDGFDFLNPTTGNKWPGTPKISWDGSKYSKVTPKVTGANGKYNTHNTVTEQGMHRHVEYLDYQIWQYLNKLKEMGIENDTILVFASDNGTSGYGKTSHDRQKGTHVPLIVYAPGSKFTKSGEQDIIASMADMLPTLADIMGVDIPSDYEIHGESLWPYLTTKKSEHRDYVYAYKSEKQLIRGKLVMKDGANKWWDVSTSPKDLISYTQIKDWSSVSPAHRSERDELNKVLPQFDNYRTEHGYE